MTSTPVTPNRGIDNTVPISLALGGQQRSSTPPRSGPAPIRFLRVCLDNRVLGSVEVGETSTLADVRQNIEEDEIQGVPENYQFLFSGAPVTRRQESRRNASACFPFGFLTIIPENAHIAANIDAIGTIAGADASPAGADPGVQSFSPHMAVSAQFETGTQIAQTDGAVGSTLELEITDGPLEGTVVIVAGEGTRVGRHTSNSLVIPEAGISRYHCEIRQTDDSFSLRDLGSVTGTFFYLKPHGHFKMFVGLMIKLGETEFQVLSQTPPGTEPAEQVVLFYEGPFAGHKVYIPASGITIGRRQDNNLVITPDGTVSAHHAAIFSEEGEYYISDLGSCNGTCIRLGSERADSDWHPIMDGDIVGAGCTKISCRVREANSAQA